MPLDSMSSIMMHVFLNDTHSLSLSPGPMGDIFVHASVAAHDTTLDNSNFRGARLRPSKYNIHRGARYDPRNGTSSYHNHVSDTMQMTCSNENEEITVFITSAIYYNEYNTNK